ncbi:MAG: hypothetical protein ABFQ62_00690 [Patescibacteria group bacterium]
MIIIHGDNIIQSRAKLLELITNAKDPSTSLGMTNIVRLEAKKLELKNLELELNSTSLFGSEQLIIIEGLHSLPSSKRKKNLIQYLISDLACRQAGIQYLENVILYESRQLTATMLKKFPSAKVFGFKTSNKLFKFLDILGQNNKQKQQLEMMKEVLKSDGDFMLLAMLIRQIRLLIQAKDGGQIKGPPFIVSKLKSQSSRFSLEKLLNIHKQLFELDLKQKTSKNILPLSSELELLIINM